MGMPKMVSEMSSTAKVVVSVLGTLLGAGVVGATRQLVSNTVAISAVQQHQMDFDQAVLQRLDRIEMKLDKR